MQTMQRVRDAMTLRPLPRPRAFGASTITSSEPIPTASWCSTKCV